MLILCGVLLTFSRGAAVAMILLFVAMAVLGELSARQVLVLAVTLAALVTVVAPDYVARVQSLAAVDSALSTGSGADGAIVGRATEDLAALYVFQRPPALGVGPGQFFRRYSSIYGNALDLRFLQTNRRAHNLYLEIAADTGILGLAAFLAIVGVTMAQLWRLNVFWRRARPGARPCRAPSCWRSSPIWRPGSSCSSPTSGTSGSCWRWPTRPCGCSGARPCAPRAPATDARRPPPGSESEREGGQGDGAQHDERREVVVDPARGLWAGERPGHRRDAALRPRRRGAIRGAAPARRRPVGEAHALAGGGRATASGSACRSGR